MSVSHVTAPSLQQARVNLSQFIRGCAASAAAEFGFGWIGAPDAPSTYPELQAAYKRSFTSGHPLPISNLYCVDTIFIEPDDNVAFRFWRDTSHCRLNLTFSLPDEWRLTMHHLAQLEQAGFGPGTDEYQLLPLDLLGQNILLGIAGRFPVNQGQFTRTCAQLGLDAGVLAELGRVS